MTADDIKALVERLRGFHKLDIVDFDLYLNAADALTTLSDQLTAKTELATLYAASLRQSEREVEALTQENQRLRLEFRADCERQAEELFEVQVDAERYRFLREKMGFTEVPGKQATMSFCGSIPAPNHNFHTDWVGARFDASVDEAIDAARSQSEEKP